MRGDGRFGISSPSSTTCPCEKSRRSVECPCLQVSAPWLGGAPNRITEEGVCRASFGLEELGGKDGGRFEKERGWENKACMAPGAQETPGLTTTTRRI